MTGLARVLRSLNCDGRYGLWLLTACAVLLALAATGDRGRTLLRYDRAALAHGELWRLLSAHFVHLDFHHALLNCAGLMLMWALFTRDYSPRQWLIIAATTLAAIDAGLWLIDSTLLWYVGSSGALHGVMAAGTLAHLKGRERDGWVLAAFLVAKLVFEHWVGPLPFSGSDPVVVDAHLYGVLGGLAGAVLLRPQAEPV
ncbi:MAG: rhombosortase [Steroidobacteraceae bacterium]